MRTYKGLDMRHSFPHRQLMLSKSKIGNTFSLLKVINIKNIKISIKNIIQYTYLILHTIHLSIYSDKIQGSRVVSVVQCLTPSISIFA